MKEIKIFIASSEELKHERQFFSDIALKLNLLLKSKEVKITFERWEFLDSSMGIPHKQEEYNGVLKECNICIALFWTILGDYTKEEFESAHTECTLGNTLKEVYLYFKDPTKEKSITEKLATFKNICRENDLQYFDFVDDKELICHIITHIDKYCQENFDMPIARIENNQLMVEHKVFANIKE